MRLMISDVVSKAIQLLRPLLEIEKIDTGHTIDHAIIVLNHSKEVLKEFTNLSEKQKLYVQLASLLHDADDHKFFSQNKNNENCRCVLKQLNLEIEEVNLILKIISLVSYRQNKNKSTEEKWMYITRYCDRVEAIGKIGIYRSYVYSIFTNRPLYLPTTPRANSIEQLYTIANDGNRAILYQGESQSMMDHFYDKILHIGSAILDFNSPYLNTITMQRIKEIEDFCLYFGLHGIVPVSKINE